VEAERPRDFTGAGEKDVEVLAFTFDNIQVGKAVPASLTPSHVNQGFAAFRIPTSRKPTDKTALRAIEYSDAPAGSTHHIGLIVKDATIAFAFKV
jgi:hypothetical protein